MTHEMAMISGGANPELSAKIAQLLNTHLVKTETMIFSDGEVNVTINETIRGKHVFIVQPTFAPAENIIELLVAADAAKRASAYKIIAVVPYYGYARQDRKDKPRTAIGAKLMANLLTAAGINRIITMDLHADQIQGFFEFPVDHLYASSVFLPYLQEKHIENLCCASPDTGGTRRAAAYAKELGADLVIGFKQRSKANVVGTLQLVGDVKDKNVILFDDIMDTGGTMCKAAELIKESGANSVSAICTHALFSGNALEKIENSALDKVIVTDTIPLKRPSDKVEVISVAEVFADVIRSVMDNTSIRSHFKMNIS